MLYVFSIGRVVFACLVVCGQAAVGKQEEEDKKTPLGEYKIKWMIDKTEIIAEKTYCIKDTELYFGDLKDAKLTPEEFKIAQDEKLWTNAYGGYIMALNYPNKKDKKNGKTGSCIELHASPKLAKQGFKEYKGTLGCVALLPNDAKKLYELVEPGTSVMIRN